MKGKVTKRTLVGSLQVRLDRIYSRLARSVAAAAAAAGVKPNSDGSFDIAELPPAITRAIDKALMEASTETEAVLVDGMEGGWTLANDANNELCNTVFGAAAASLSPEMKRRYYSTNGAALDAFIKRKEAGMTLAERVWDITKTSKDLLVNAVAVGIGGGQSADDMARDIKQYLKEPNRLFRRVRDANGELHLSKPAAAYHPGQGVYRSSYKNAMRLTRTETNMAYENADKMRWQNEDFVVGIRIQLSESHPVEDICDDLAGDYPKDLVFEGWHPQCLCFATPITLADNELKDFVQATEDGRDYDYTQSKNYVGQVPEKFKTWIRKNEGRVATASSLPYFIQHNPKIVGELSEAIRKRL